MIKYSFPNIKRMLEIWYHLIDITRKPSFFHITCVVLQQRDKVASLTLTQLDNASNDDDNEGRHLGIGENVLHTGPPLYIGSVYERQ